MARRLSAGNLAALALGLVVGLAVLEAGVRWRFRPEPPGPEIELNADGFRDVDHSLTKPDGLMRLAFIGDSYTFGQGVEREERFSERVARTLDDAWSDTRVEVLNFGRPGASTDDVLRIFEGGTVHYEPDVVVYSFVLNDFSTPARDRTFRDLRDRVLEEHRARFPGLRWAAARLRTAAVVDKLLFDTTSGIEEAQREFLDSLYRPGDDLERMSATLRRLVREISNRSLLGVIVFMPYFLPGEDDLPFYGRARDLVAEAAARRRLVFVEVLPWLSDRPYHEWWVSVSDHHPNAAAHARIAEHLSAVVLERTGPRWERFAARRTSAAEPDAGQRDEQAAGIVPGVVDPPSNADRR